MITWLVLHFLKIFLWAFFSLTFVNRCTYFTNLVTPGDYSKTGKVYRYIEKYGISIHVLICSVFLLLKMHKNVNINNKMLSDVSKGLMAAIIAEKNVITR
jgi:hypothetical protein